jgi:DNA-binding transcriptional MerR regulator
MQSGTLSIGELADAAGLSRRAIRFYVQRGLLPPPLSVGRGRHYDDTHLARLRRIADLQSTGYSLDAIARLLEGHAVDPPPPAPANRPRVRLAAELWTRLRLAEGLELHLDATRFNPDAQQLLALQEAVRAVLIDEASQETQPDPLAPSGHFTR